MLWTFPPQISDAFFLPPTMHGDYSQDPFAFRKPSCRMGFVLDAEVFLMPCPPSPASSLSLDELIATQFFYERIDHLRRSQGYSKR